MKICYFGTYEKDYPRNRNIINGLAANNIEVVECHVDLYAKLENKINLSPAKKIFLMLRAALLYLKLITKRFSLGKIDYVIVGYPGQLDMFLARLLFLRKKIIFNPMLSIYDTMIEDRKISNNFLIKKSLYYLDRLSCRLANKIILDTPEHADYFVKKFKIPRQKLEHVYIGADESKFFPLEKNYSAKFKVLFYGKFSPIHGIDTIIKAAKILSVDKSVELEIIGTGQLHNKMLRLAKDLKVENIKFVDWVDFDKLPTKIAQADVCIGGHFGSSQKGRRVVANKVFQMIAMKRPVIIADCQTSLTAGFVDQENCLFCQPEDAKELTRKILILKNDSALADKIAKGAFHLFNDKFTISKTGKAFKGILQYKQKSTWLPTPAYKMRKRTILEYVRHNKVKANNFLEIGVATGDMTASLSPYFVTGTGVDISQEAVDTAKHNVSHPKIKFEFSDFLQRPENDKYQLIVALEVLEHMENDKAALNKINSLLSKNGTFIMSVPAHQKQWSVLDEWAGHYRRYEKKELIELLEDAGFKIIKFYNYGFPLSNMLWFIRKKLIKKDKVMSSKEGNTTRSGLDRSVAGKFKFFFNDFFVLPFYILQKLFSNLDLSPAYLVVVKKNIKA